MALGAGTGRGATQRLLLATLYALPTCMRSQGPSDFESLAASHPGCFFKGYQYGPDSIAPPAAARSLASCQFLCKAQLYCEFFTYLPASGECHFSDANATRVEVKVQAIAGFAVCPAPAYGESAACTVDLPQNGFPGFSASDSNGAWPSGVQPGASECWPKDERGSLLACSAVTVVQDSAQGWPFTCKNLTNVTLRDGVSGDEACAASCRKNPLCPAWQIGPRGSCLQGQGSDCYTAKQFSPIKAQRFQHGQVRKLMDLAGWQIAGLSRAFLKDVEGYFRDDADAIEACRLQCYSDLGCQYWQYAPGFGCWLQDPRTAVQPGYPLTLDFAYRSTPFALDCKAGEMIQHVCPPGSVEFEEPSCVTAGVRYVPASGAWHKEWIATSAGACQYMCQTVPLCRYFTYWSKGRCDLEEGSAAAVRASGAVVSGPRSCAEQLTTAAPEAGPSPAPAPARPAALPAPPPAAGQDRDPSRFRFTYVVGANYTISGLGVDQLRPERAEHLMLTYVSVLAHALRVGPTLVMDAPQGTPAQVSVRSVGASTSELTAWTMNQPPTSFDLTHLQSVLLSSELAADLRQATEAAVGMGNTAITGVVAVEANPLSRVELSEPVVAEAAAGTHWELIVVVVLLVLACVIVAILAGIYLYCEHGPGRPFLGPRVLDGDPLYSDSDEVGYAGLARSKLWEFRGAVRRQLLHRRGEFTV